MANPEGNSISDQTKNNPEAQRGFEKKSEHELPDVQNAEAENKIVARKSAEERAKLAQTKGDTMMTKVDPTLKDSSKLKEAKVGTNAASKAISAKIGENVGAKVGKSMGKLAEAKFGKAAGVITELGLTKAGEYLGELGLTQTIANNLPNVVGGEQIADQVVDIVATKSSKKTAEGGLKIAVKGLEKMGMKKGMEALSKEMSLQIERKVVSKLGKFAGQEMMIKILKKAGFKASILAFTTATPIPLDDVIGLGMAGLMAKDAYDIAVLTKKAIDIGKTMNENGKKEILSIDPIGEISIKSYNEALEL